MNLFSQLLLEVRDHKIPLSSILLTARVLASDLRSRKFRAWVKSELNGYSGKRDLPEYRIVPAQCRGDFIGAYHIQRAVLPLHNLPRDMLDFFDRQYFTDGIGGLEAMAGADTEEFHSPWADEQVTLYRLRGGFGYKYCQLTEAYRVVPKPMIEGVLHAVRSRLLEFLLQLREAHPELTKDDEAAAAVPEEEATRLFDQCIFNNCNIPGGDQSMAHNEINAEKISVGGHFVVADAINNSFNKINGSKAPETAKTLLKELGDAIAKVCEEVPDKAEEAAQDFDTIATEMSKAAPRKGVLTAALDGLKGTAGLALKYGPQAVVLIGAIHELAKNW